MLGDHPMDVLLLATDLAASREFYASKIGLEIDHETDYAVWFRSGHECRLAIGASTTGTADRQDQATWRVQDVRAEVEQLRARGVEILEYDISWNRSADGDDVARIKTEDGVADIGHAYAAWFVDPGGNSLSILQFK